MNRVRSIALMVAVMALGSVAIAQAQPQSGIVRPTTEPATPSVQLGAELFAGNCASCHGIAGAGITTPRPGAGGILGAGPPLRGVGALAADFYLRTGYMPLSSIHDQPYNDRVLFSEKEIRSLTRYVASLGHGPGDTQSQPGLRQHLRRPAAVHLALRRVSPDRRPRRLRDRRESPTASGCGCHSDRRGRPRSGRT